VTDISIAAGEFFFSASGLLFAGWKVCRRQFRVWLLGNLAEKDKLRLQKREDITGNGQEVIPLVGVIVILSTPSSETALATNREVHQNCST